MHTVSNYWQQVGVPTETLLTPRGYGRDERSTRPGFHLQRRGADLVDLFEYHTSQVPLPENRFQGGNLPRYSNKDLDPLLERFVTTIPPGERQKLLGPIIQHLTDQVVDIGLLYDGEPIAISNRLVNVFAKGEGNSPTVWNVLAWDIRSWAPSRWLSRSKPSGVGPLRATDGRAGVSGAAVRRGKGMSVTTRFGVLGLVLTLGVTACGVPPEGGRSGDGRGEQRQGGPKRIIAAIRGDLETVAESESLSAGGGEGKGEILDLLHGGFTIGSDQGGLQPRLAEAVPTIENGLWKVFPDGRMETTWKLKPGIQWHDGVPFSVEDVLFTAQVALDSDFSASRHVALRSIDSIDAPDASTVTVRWKATYIEADGLFSRQPVLLPRHLLEGPFQEDKQAFKGHPYWASEFVGLGPYRLKEWALSSHMLLEANQHYVPGRPKVDTMEIRFILDHNALMANVLAGTIHLTLGRGLSLDQAFELRDQWRDGRVGLSFTSWIALYPQFLNPNPPVVADVRFRKALMYATNRQEMADAFLGGISYVAHSFLSPTRPEYREVEASLVKYEYDPAKAAQLLQQLGYTTGPDGFFRDQDDRPLSLEVRARTALDIQQKALFSVTDQWQRAGVRVEPVPVPDRPDPAWRADYPAFEIVRQPNALDVASLRRYHGDQANLPEKNYAGTNRTRYRNPEYDALIDRFATTIPRGDRIPVLGRIVRHMSDQLNIMGLFYDIEATVYSHKLSNITPNAKELGTSTSWNAEAWDIQ